MTFKLPHDPVGIFVALALSTALTYVLGLASGAALTQRELPAEIAVQVGAVTLLVLGSMVAVLRVLIPYFLSGLERQIEENTAITVQAADHADRAANHADDRVAMRQELTWTRARMEKAERVAGLVDILMDCGPCREKIASYLDAWKKVYQEGPYQGDSNGV